MRVWIKCLLGAAAVVLIAAYAEFVIDFRGPRSELKSENGLAAITLTSYGDRDKDRDKIEAIADFILSSPLDRLQPSDFSEGVHVLRYSTSEEMNEWLGRFRAIGWLYVRPEDDKYPMPKAWMVEPGLRARAKDGDRVRAADDVAAGTVDGKWTITVDGSVIEEGPIVVKLAGMYGLFAVASDDTAKGIFSFSIVPGRAELSRATSVQVLRDRFENFPARFLAFEDTDLAVDSCAAPPTSELGFGSIGAFLGMQAQTYCIVHWKGTHPSSMLISVTLANGDPWMRPFARWICRSMTLATLRKLASPNGQPPTYAACVLVDRADRRRPGDVHEIVESVVYEIRDRTLARMN